MKIGGFVKQNLSDYPGKLACIVFTTGCNFKCPYCHNPQLVANATERIPEKVILDYCARSKELLEGIVINGGEPSIQSGLVDFIRKVRRYGLAVKLDTNGTNPEVLADLIANHLVDYIAMDIKSAFTLGAYTKASGTLMSPHQLESVLQSVHLILDSEIPHEFRTTLCKELVSKADLSTIIAVLKGCDKYYLQKLYTDCTLRPDAAQYTAYTDLEIAEIIDKVPMGFPIYYRS